MTHWTFHQPVPSHVSHFLPREACIQYLPPCQTDVLHVYLLVSCLGAPLPPDQSWWSSAHPSWLISKATSSGKPSLTPRPWGVGPFSALCQTLWPDQPYGSCHPVPPDLSVCLPLMRLSFLGAGPRSLSLHLSPLRWYLFHGGSPLVFAKERSQRTKEFIWDAAKISQSSENTLKRVTHESCPVDLSFPDCFHYKSILNTVKEMWEWKR